MSIDKLFSLLLLVISHPIWAQGDFRKGHVIKLDKDSISGWIKFKGDIKNSVSCTFKNESGHIEEYRPQDIRGYRFDPGKYYITKYVKATGQYALAEYLVEGKKNLYFIRDRKGFHFMIDQRGDTIEEISYKEEYLYKDGTYYKKESTTHRNLLKNYFRECPAIFPEIENLKRPDFSNLIKLSKDYHDITCNSNCIVYYKKTPLKVFIEPHMERYYVHNGSSIFDKYSAAQFGAQVYLSMPNASERLYFKTGFLYSSLRNNADNKLLVVTKIPLQLEYLFGNNLIRPKVDFGVNYISLHYSNLTDHALFLSCSTGVVLKLNSAVYADFGISADLWNFIYGTPFFLAHSFDSGLRLKL